MKIMWLIKEMQLLATVHYFNSGKLTRQLTQVHHVTGELTGVTLQVSYHRWAVFQVSYHRCAIFEVSHHKYAVSQVSHHKVCRVTGELTQVSR